MENRDNIELFDLYLNEHLSAEEKRAFEERITSDKDFRNDFRIFLLSVDGIMKEVRQDNIELGVALKNIDNKKLKEIIGKDEKIRKAPPIFTLKKKIAWVSSVAATIIVGLVAVLGVMKQGRDNTDEILAYYNDIYTADRGGDESINLAAMNVKEIEDIIPRLEKEYAGIDEENMQDRQIAGFTLAMAYLRTHQRDKAKALLQTLEKRYSDDEMFAEKCREILRFLR